MDGLEAIESTVLAVLEHATLRARTGIDGVQLMTDEQRAAILEAYGPVLDADMELLRECLRQAMAVGVQRMHHALHETAVDPELLDEAFYYAEVPE